MSGSQFAFGTFVLDAGARRLVKDGHAVPIPARAFDTLAALVRSAGRVVEKDDLLHRVWPDTVVEETKLGQQIFLLRKLLGDGPKDPRYIATVPRRGYRFVAPVREVASADAVANAGAAAASTGAEAERLPIRLTLMLPPGAPLALGACPPFALSPDGRLLAYISLVDDTTGLFVRRMDRFDVIRFEGTAGAYSPFFSPDSSWIGFFARGRLWKVPARGGVPVAICEAGDECRGASWGRSDDIVFAPAPASGLFIVPASGGTPRAATSLDFDEGERTHRWPCVLPNGTDVLFTVARAGSASFNDADIVMASLETGVRRRVLRHATYARAAPTGHLLYMRGGSLMAVAFDPDRLTIDGSAVPLVERVMTQPTGAGHFTFAETGPLVYVSGETEQVLRHLVRVDAARRSEALPIPEQAFEEPRLSPDGRRLAVGIRAALNDIWIYDFARGGLRRMTFEADNFAAIWTPDGQRLTFSSNRNGPCHIYWRSVADGAEAEPLVGSDYDLVPGAWTKDGERLLFTEYHPDSGADIWMCAPGKIVPPQPIVRSPANEFCPALSPCNRWLAYTSDESGRAEVYVVPFPAADRRIQVSDQGGSEPIWARDGATLYYRSGSTIVGAAWAWDAGEVIETTVALDGPYLPGAFTGLPNFDVTAAGEFLMIEQEAARARPDVMSVIVNWSADLPKAAY